MKVSEESKEKMLGEALNFLMEVTQRTDWTVTEIRVYALATMYVVKVIGEEGRRPTSEEVADYLIEINGQSLGSDLAPKIKVN